MYMKAHLNGVVFIGRKKLQKKKIEEDTRSIVYTLRIIDFYARIDVIDYLKKLLN